MTQLRTFDVSDWLRIADGQAKLPAAFQRMMAAWELVETWKRSKNERLVGDFFDRHLIPAVRDLDLGNDQEWGLRTETLRADCPVSVMVGGVSTDEIKTFANACDIVNIIGVLYTVRCNLIHGGKTPASRRDLRITTRAAAVTAHFARRLLY